MTESQLDPETLRAIIARELTSARQRTSLLTDSVDERRPGQHSIRR